MKSTFILLFNKLFDVLFSKNFSIAAQRMVSILKDYQLRFLMVACCSIIVVLLDMLSALSVGALLLALEGVEKIPVPSVGEIFNPLQNLSESQAMVYCVLAIVVMQLLRELSLLGNDLFLRKLSIDVSANTREKISKVALLSSFERVVNMNRNDLIIYGTTLAAGVGTFAMEFSRLFGILIILLLYSFFFIITEPVAFVLIMSLVVVLIILTNRLLIRLEGLSYKTRDATFVYHDDLYDGVIGLRDITIFGRQHLFLNKVKNSIQLLKSLQWHSNIVRSIITPVQRSIALIFLGTGLIALVLLSGDGGTAISPKRLIFILFILLRMYGPVSQMNTTRSGLIGQAGSVSTITDFLDSFGESAEQTTAPVDPSSEQSLKISDIKEETKHFPSEELTIIILDNIFFYYGEESLPALSGVGFSIPGQMTTAIVGPSGSGKSTIVDLLTCLRTPSSGTIRIGDIPLVELEINAWRNKIATIHQQGHIFHGTIAENITLFRDDFSSEEINEAASRANFLDFVRATPQGMETRLGGPDNPLSGGQRQRLQIARAFLVRPKLLILDEATSAQDALLEEALLRSIKRDFADTTILVIAHRFSAIREADHIIVMDEGRVVDTGDWDSLMKRPGLFKGLYEAQSLER